MMRFMAIFAFVSLIMINFSMNFVSAEGQWGYAISSVDVSDVNNSTASGSSSASSTYEITRIISTSSTNGIMSASFTETSLFVTWSGGNPTLASKDVLKTEVSNTSCGDYYTECYWTKSFDIPSTATNISISATISDGTTSISGGIVYYSGVGARGEAPSTKPTSKATASVNTPGSTSQSTAGYGTIAYGGYQLIDQYKNEYASSSSHNCSSVQSWVSVTAGSNASNGTWDPITGTMKNVKTATAYTTCQFWNLYYYYTGSATLTYTMPETTTTYDYSGTVTYEYRYWISNSPPNVSFSDDAPSSIYRGTTITVTSGCSDPDGYIASRSWSGAVSGSGVTASFTPDALGSYTVDHSCADDFGEWGPIASKSYTVSNRRPFSQITTPSGSSINSPSMNVPPFRAAWSYSDSDGDPQTKFNFRVYRADTNLMVINTGFVSSGNSYYDIPAGVLEMGQKYYAVVSTYDGYAWSGDSIRKYFATAGKPMAEFSWTPSPIWEGDTIQLRNESTDPAGSILTSAWTVTGPGGYALSFSSEDAAIPGSGTAYRPGEWSVTLTVTNSSGMSDSETKTLTVGNLEIAGQVLHSADWESYRQAWNMKNPSKQRSLDTFWAGEVFMLQAAVTDTSVSGTKPQQVSAILLATGDTTAMASGNDIDYAGRLLNVNFPKLLSDGVYTMQFRAVWNNGHTEVHNVPFTVAGDINDVIVTQLRN